MNAAEVREALRRHYGITSSDLLTEEWALLDEVALKASGWTTARIDCLAVRAWGGMPKGHERVAIEIKVSKADFAKEMKSGKWQHFHQVCHRFAFAVPHGLVAVDQVPEECGLIEVSNGGRVRWTKKAPRHEPQPLPDVLFAEIARRLSRFEERLRRGSVEDPAAEIARLRLEVAHLQAQRQATDARVDKYRRQVAKVLADVNASVTCECGRPIAYHRGRKAWRHTDVVLSDDLAFHCRGSRVAWHEQARPALDEDERPDARVSA